MSEFSIQPLLTSPLVSVRDIACRGSCHHKGPEEAPEHIHLVFPYRGVYLRHLGSDTAVAEPNQVLMFNVDQGYRVSHPVHGGDACLDIVVDEARLRELAPTALTDGARLAFRAQRLPLAPRSQALATQLRHSLAHHRLAPLAAEALALDLVRHALGAAAAPSTSAARRRLVDRAKLVLAGDLARRWTLADIAAELAVSPVYLTQLFQQLEGVPLYRYQLRLRLARALDQLARADDLSALAHDLGFSSHSHFTAAFRQAYGRSPSTFRRSIAAPPRV